MRTLIAGACVVLSLLWSPSFAEADPFSFLSDGSIVFNTVFSTSGTFRCRGPVACTTDTNTITFGTEASHATITFNGVTDTMLQVGTTPIPVTLGVFETSFTPGFVFPVRTSKTSPILEFDLFVEHSSPTTASKTKVFNAGPGGTPDLRLFPIPGTGNSFSTPTGATPPGFNYPVLVYRIRLPLVLSGAGPSTMVARVGAAPEPATLVLLSTGLAWTGWSRRRTRKIQG